MHSKMDEKDENKILKKQTNENKTSHNKINKNDHIPENLRPE